MEVKVKGKIEETSGFFVKSFLFYLNCAEDNKKFLEN